MRILQGIFLQSERVFACPSLVGSALFGYTTKVFLFTNTLNSDFNWYEIGDVISIGTKNLLYYCFPKEKGDFAAKARLATEEIYKLVREERTS